MWFDFPDPMPDDPPLRGIFERLRQTLFSEQSSMRRWRTQAHEKDPPRVFVSVAVGIGIGIAFGIKVAVDEHLDTDSDSDPDSDPRISRHPLYFRSRN